MSGASSIGNFNYRWNLMASGVASVDAVAKSSDLFHHDPTLQDDSGNRNTVESATITKRLSDGAMIIFRYDKHVQVSYGVGTDTGNHVNLTA
ncbi:hypothetical protein SAMN05216582_13227 [Selenomonas ruminantium]|uniref:Uncharacterized protein n=1 Tax=Selenomonas ruminantium TaxID=971 RepID=A0A1M6X6Z1_SELRU|nr:hypothetical protein [Selenomonas ruminantium]SHL01704.1 hypothetical protein SAMN05216582_13227 [Selenomonas ruminantium]